MSKTNRMTLEKKLSSMFHPNAAYTVLAHELLHDGMGWSVNDSWYMAQDCNRAKLLYDARNRWEIFKLNYSKSARVNSIDEDGDENTCYINAEGIPFLEVRINNEFIYSIDLDERGSFCASVRNGADETVYNIKAGNELAEDESSIFEDGFMKDKNDIEGLLKYLISLDVLPKDSTLTI